MNIYVINLGCAKNSVDSENLIGMLEGSGFHVVKKLEEAQVALVNTCGFIQPAVEESIDVILDLEKMKQEGHLQKIGVVGCLVNRYGEDLKKELPTVDIWARSEEWESVILQLGGAPAPWHRGQLPETRLWSRYLKVGEGCDSFCSYCTIPSIRGRARSYPIERLVNQATHLVEEGAKEICLVGQDLTIYGRDIYGKSSLLSLLNALSCAIPQSVWLRLLYLHPDRIDSNFIDCLGDVPGVLPYLDIPIQHVDEHILRAMNRKGTESSLRHLFEYIRAKNPLFALRTTLIVGFPGETDVQFEKVLDFLEDMEIDRVGAFTYCQEDGTVAATLSEQIPQDVKEERYRRLMELQSEISWRRQQLFEGKELMVLVEEKDIEEGIAWGRSYRDAPEVDGLVGIINGAHLQEGALVNVKIKEASEYDLLGVEVPR
ncbi:MULTISPECIES: 30S ribosomal protein S12 methylthiotransferase RimO [Aminobacterium]|uniref:30S ribosomal protein S12 methylthiotransferase RimO n=1 Tax=Aminobacterium TaxID=81466 RepID=UPI00257D73AE|nr:MULTISPECIES: 30S ribosomal protein S12 methylthiotransferase RimO [unclassified Aminobacterium]